MSVSAETVSSASFRRAERSYRLARENRLSKQAPGEVDDLGLAGMTMAEIERRALIETLRACGGNKTRTARLLGVSEKTIYNKIKQHKLTRHPSAEAATGGQLPRPSSNGPPREPSTERPRRP